MLHNFAFKNRLHHLCAAAIAIFSYLLSGDECKAVIKTLESKSPALTPSNGQYQTAGMFCQLSAQFNGLSQKIRSFFLAVLFPNPQFKIDEVSFCTDICHNWCISVKTLVGTGYAFLIGFRIVKGGYINIDRNKAVIQGCRLYVHFTQHVDICLLDVFAQGSFF